MKHKRLQAIAMRAALSIGRRMALITVIWIIALGAARAAGQSGCIGDCPPLGSTGDGAWQAGATVGINLPSGVDSTPFFVTADAFGNDTGVSFQSTTQTSSSNAAQPVWIITLVPQGQTYCDGPEQPIAAMCTGVVPAPVTQVTTQVNSTWLAGATDAQIANAFADETAHTFAIDDCSLAACAETSTSYASTGGALISPSPCDLAAISQFSGQNYSYPSAMAANIANAPNATEGPAGYDEQLLCSDESQPYCADRGGNYLADVEVSCSNDSTAIYCPDGALPTCAANGLSQCDDGGVPGNCSDGSASIPNCDDQPDGTYVACDNDSQAGSGACQAYDYACDDGGASCTLSGAIICDDDSTPCSYSDPALSELCLNCEAPDSCDLDGDWDCPEGCGDPGSGCGSCNDPGCGCGGGGGCGCGCNNDACIGGCGTCCDPFYWGDGNCCDPCGCGSCDPYTDQYYPPPAELASVSAGRRGAGPVLFCLAGLPLFPMRRRRLGARSEGRQ